MRRKIQTVKRGPLKGNKAAVKVGLKRPLLPKERRNLRLVSGARGFP